MSRFKLVAQNSYISIIINLINFQKLISSTLVHRNTHIVSLLRLVYLTWKLFYSLFACLNVIVQLLNLFKKTPAHNRIVAISFLADGIAVAISERFKAHALKLIHAEFIAAYPHEEQQHALNELITKFDLKGCDCHIVLAYDDYRRINIDAPNVTGNEIIEAIRWKINELIDFAVDNAVIDYYPAPQLIHSNKARTLEVIACQQHIIQTLVEKCTQTGFQVKVVDIPETSLRNLAVLLPENGQGISVLYLQKFSGVMLIQKDATLYVFRKFDLGYKKLELHAPFIRGMAPEAAHSNLALEIQRSLDYVESYYQLLPVSELAVIPFDNYSLDLVTTLTNNYGIKAGIVDIPTLVGSDIELDHATQSLCAVVIGASLRDSEKTKYLQEVNLYQNALQPSRYSVLTVYSVILTLIILPVLVYSGYSIKGLKQLEAQVQQTQNRLNEEESQLKLALAKVPKTEVNPELDKEIIQWQQAITDLNQTVEQIASKNAIQSQGFSPFFQALAKQSAANIWLTRLYFNRQQHIIRLEGSTLKSEQLPLFLQLLQQQPAFQGYSFARLIMKQSTENPVQIDFRLSTTQETEDKNDHVH